MMRKLVFEVAMCAQMKVKTKENDFTEMLKRENRLLIGKTGKCVIEVLSECW